MKKLRNNARGYILDMFAQHHMVKRTVLSFLSIVIMGFGTALFNVSGFGVDPFTSMNMSVAAVLGISFGTYQLIVNAVITEVDAGKQTITVKDDADESTLGEECLIDCPSTPMVYCDFATQKVTRISFEELQVNDRVIVSIRSSEMESFRSGGNEENTLKVEQLQLYTQRPAE